MAPLTTEQKTHFSYLNDLRESGATNMFGAAPFLAEEYGITKSAASKVVGEWMQWYPGEPGDLDG